MVSFPEDESPNIRGDKPDSRVVVKRGQDWINEGIGVIQCGNGQ
jgi:hypothetical protein